jgi:Holliday junction resolvase RusA-like endonuclease
MSIDRYAITVGIPHRCLSPNNTPATPRGHIYKRKAYARVRDAAHTAMMVAMIGPPPKWEKATAQATFYYRIRRNRDQDNLAAMLKAVWDGIAGAGLIINDHGLTPLPPQVITGVEAWEEKVGIVIWRTS